MLVGSYYLSLRSLCKLQKAWLEIVYFSHSNGNLYSICNTRNNSDFHAGTWPRGNSHGTQPSAMEFKWDGVRTPVSVVVWKDVVSLHHFLCILISRSLPNVKEKYMTTFRHKLIHNSITQSKASRSIMATPTSDYYITHSMHVQDDVWYNARHCTATTLNLRLIW